MIVDISDFALEQINRTADYIWQVFGDKSQEKFMNDIYHTMSLLAINPLMGPIEPSLAHLPIEFHSIVIARKNKAIYHIVSDSIIKVVAFWDCRRDPNTLVAQVTDRE